MRRVRTLSPSRRTLRKTLTTIRSQPREEPSNQEVALAEISSANLISKGAYGQVFKVVRDGKTYAQKVYIRLPDLNEIDILTRYRHPNLLHAIDVTFDGHELHVILPYAKYDLLSYLQAKGTLSFGKLLNVAHKLFSALDFMHNTGMYHCDVKPENVLIQENGEILLADFGLSFQDSIQHRMTMCGTPSYGSPQTVFLKFDSNSSEWGRIPIAVRQEIPSRISSDIYAAGVILYECITGDKLIDMMDSYAKLASGYARAENKIAMMSLQTPQMEPFWKIIKRCCALLQSDRYTSIQEILEEPIFRTMSPIEGKVLNIDIRSIRFTSFARQPRVPYASSMKYVLGWLMNVTSQLRPYRPLEVLSQSFQLMYRMSPLSKTPQELSLYALGAIWMAQCLVNGTRTFDVSMMKKYGPEENITYVINKSIGAFHGKLMDSSAVTFFTEDAFAALYVLDSIVQDIHSIRLPSAFLLDTYNALNIKNTLPLDVVRIVQPKGEGVYELGCTDRRVFQVVIKSKEDVRIRQL